MRCPRCKAEAAEAAAACPRCAAPLSLREEPAPAALDVDLRLDRRRGERRPDAPAIDETDPAPWRRAGREAGAGPPDTSEPSTSREGRAEAPRPSVPAGPGPVPRVTPRFWWKEPVEEAPLPRPPGGDPALDLALGEPGPGEPTTPAADEAGFEILGPAAEARQEEPPAPQPPPARLRQVPLPLPPTGPWPPAPAGLRLLSWLVDGLLAAALAWLLLAGGSLLAGPDAAAPSVAALLPAAAGLAAAIHFVHAALGVGLAGQTLGKWMTALQVLGPDGRLPGPGRAAARALLSLFSAGLLGLGLLPALAGRRARALHDIALATEVVRAP